MRHVDRLIRRASLRLWFSRLCHFTAWTVAGACGLVTLWRVIDLMITVPTDWAVLWIVALGMALVSGIGLAWWKRPNRMAVARFIDERAGLRESLSTALWTAHKQDDWSLAARCHADEIAEHVSISQVVPTRPSWVWTIAPILAVTFLGLGFLPHADLLKVLETERIAEARQAEILQAHIEVRAAAADIEQALAGLQDGASLLEDLQLDVADPEAKTPDEIRKAQIRSLTTLADRLTELEQQGSGETFKATSEQLRQLHQPRDAEMKQLDAMVRALQSGDMRAAIDAIEDLSRKIDSEGLTPEQRMHLANQLEDLARQLQDLSEANLQEMRDALERHGIDPKLAENPEALEQAIQNAANLSPELKQALKKMAKAAQGACQQCNNMGEGMKNLSQAIRQGSNAGSAFGQVAGQLSELELMQGEMDRMQAARAQILRQVESLAGQCRGGANGLPSFEKWSLASVAGSGRRGAAGNSLPGGREGGASGSGNNLVDQADPSQFATRRQQSSSLIAGDAPPIGSTMIEGEQIRGESRQQFAEVVRLSSRNAAEAIETLVVPREYHDAVKAYFGQLERRANDESAGQTPAENSIQK